MTQYNLSTIKMSDPINFLSFIASYRELIRSALRETQLSD